MPGSRAPGRRRHNNDKSCKKACTSGKFFNLIRNLLGFGIGQTVNAGHGFLGVDSLRPQYSLGVFAGQDFFKRVAGCLTLVVLG